MTISISGYCPKTGQLGIAISSSSIAVGQRCPWILSGVGAVSSQNVTLPALGPAILQQMQQGKSAAQALAAVIAQEPYHDYRQVTVMDSQGESAVWSGNRTLGVWQATKGECCIAAGNMLANLQVTEVAVKAFESHQGELSERLLHALEAALAAGGEAGPVHSAALKTYAEQSWPLADLRVDWADNDPVVELRQLWQRWQPQQQDYLTRALDPRLAPSYGVPGNE
ncbi:DUF1028 domain-containing protein [Rosenbergiella australiborealis]|uniref:DUF1028 domain-containing protein n=1 Tax=Rosenbergiella australiborealis TaxID=1544696 RepID=A0ABS5T3H1_9GAMM|nr:DUF1028 domain-containing protein [Rosenbergiella australiborealis]MBT0726891.1 DUF1028 domain-containing protein [Rosenbergiella australiborealis]